MLARPVVDGTDALLEYASDGDWHVIGQWRRATNGRTVLEQLRTGDYVWDRVTAMALRRGPIADAVADTYRSVTRSEAAKGPPPHRGAAGLCRFTPSASAAAEQHRSDCHHAGDDG